MNELFSPAGLASQVFYQCENDIYHKVRAMDYGKSFVTIASCNHLIRIISTYVGNTKKVRSREDDNYLNSTIKYGL